MIFTANIIKARQSKLAQVWESLLSSSDCVLVCAGDPIPKPGGLDQVYPFLPHPSYFWITGYRLPFGVALYSKDLGWVPFVRPLSQAELVWEGAAEFEEQGQHISQLVGFIKKHQFKRCFLIGQPSSVTAFLEPQQLAAFDDIWNVKIQMDRVRRVKDKEEVALVKDVARIAGFGFQKMKSVLQVGITEKDLQAEYEAEILKKGAHGLPYTTLVGSGVNASVLHSLPTGKKIASGDWVLVDAGAEKYDYCVDITRMLAVEGTFSSQQAMIYNLVKEAQLQAIDKARPGVQWHSVHEHAASVIAEGLKNLNLIRCSVSTALESGAISVFFPHGVGHLVGLRVRDTGHEENRNPKKYCGVQIRVDFALEENFMITVEPGCYFIKALIMNPDIRSKYQDMINWSEAEKWLNMGGVRIEDDILITAQAPEVLTAMIEK